MPDVPMHRRLPAGTELKVLWHGDDCWYEGRVVGHRAIMGASGVYDWAHSVEYSSGVYEHKLADCEHEILRMPSPGPCARGVRTPQRRAVESSASPAVASGKRVEKAGHLGIRRTAKSKRKPLRTISVGPNGLSAADERRMQSCDDFLRV